MENNIGGFYDPLYEKGDILVNCEGHKITILDIVGDQYAYSDKTSEINPRYEFCNVIDYWYTTAKTYSDWLTEVNGRVKGRIRSNLFENTENLA